VPDEDILEPDQSAQDPLHVLLGQTADGCWIGYGAVLFLEFGELTFVDGRRKHPCGEWSLWCDQILWRMEQGSRVLAGSEDDAEVMEAAIAHLNGRTLISAAVDPDTGHSTFMFTDELVLRTFVVTSEEDARWNLGHRDSPDSPWVGPPYEKLCPRDGPRRPRGHAPMTPVGYAAAIDASKVLCNALVWRVRLNIQHRFERASQDDLYSPEDLDAICLDFHEPLPEAVGFRKHRRVGSLWVNVANCGVRLAHKEKSVVRSGDSTATILDRFPRLLDHRLIEVRVDYPGGDTRFMFDEGVVLTCFPANTTGGASWVIVTEGGDEFQFGPGVSTQASRP
jgi:hypothetical protein